MNNFWTFKALLFNKFALKSLITPLNTILLYFILQDIKFIFYYEIMFVFIYFLWCLNNIVIDTFILNFCAAGRTNPGRRTNPATRYALRATQSAEFVNLIYYFYFYFYFIFSLVLGLVLGLVFCLFS
jgi:hypothetical protein